MWFSLWPTADALSVTAVPTFPVAVSQPDSIACILNAYLEGKEQQNDRTQRERDLQSKGRQTALKKWWFGIINYMDGNYELSIY